MRYDLRLFSVVIIDIHSHSIVAIAKNMYIYSLHHLVLSPASSEWFVHDMYSKTYAMRWIPRGKKYVRPVACCSWSYYQEIKWVISFFHIISPWQIRQETHRKRGWYRIAPLVLQREGKVSNAEFRRVGLIRGLWPLRRGSTYTYKCICLHTWTLTNSQIFEFYLYRSMVFIKIPDKARGECCCREPQCCAILCPWMRGVACKTLQAALISFSFRLCAAQQWPHCPACRAASIFELQGDDEVWFNDQCSTPCCMYVWMPLIHWYVLR